MFDVFLVMKETSSSKTLIHVIWCPVELTVHAVPYLSR
jgi:hypothetical protein